jgi:hypothetical protein
MNPYFEVWMDVAKALIQSFDGEEEFWEEVKGFDYNVFHDGYGFTHVVVYRVIDGNTDTSEAVFRLSVQGDIW